MTKVSKLISFFNLEIEDNNNSNHEHDKNCLKNKTHAFYILGVSSPSPVITNNLYPRLHPQVDLLASENTETPTL